jgi:hypothetical protein
LATSAIGAVLEAFQYFGHGVLPQAELRSRRRAVAVAPPSAPVAAALVSARARGLGVTQALWAGAAHGLTQRWARSLRRAGWLALWTGAQHDPTGRTRSVSLFDEAGEHLPYGDSAWQVEALSLADDPDIVAGLARYGVQVLADIDPPFVP